MEHFTLKTSQATPHGVEGWWNKKNATLKQVGEAESQSHHKPQPPCNDPQSGGNSQLTNQELLFEKQRVHTLNQAPTIKNDLHLRNEPSKHLALKTNGAHIHKIQRTVANEQLVWTHSPQGPAQKKPFEKHPGFL